MRMNSAEEVYPMYSDITHFREVLEERSAKLIGQLETLFGGKWFSLEVPHFYNLTIDTHPIFPKYMERVIKFDFKVLVEANNLPKKREWLNNRCCNDFHILTKTLFSDVQFDRVSLNLSTNATDYGRLLSYARIGYVQECMWEKISAFTD